jgi:zinc D-Ala-D-Ala dipeptidase
VISYADQAALIDDPRVLRIAITDNGEPLVDLRSITALAVDHARTVVQQLSDNPFHVRAGVAGRLARSQASLPGGYQLQIKEWGFNQPGEGSRTAAPVNQDARHHRDILAAAMNPSGFINYPAEWWHWSYGDRYWAFQAGHDTACYGPLSS